MLVIRVVSFKGQPVGGDLVAQFGEAGGTIGRGKNSTLVLPDPELFISRTHAIISFQAGGFIVTDNGTKNPVILNGQPLGAGAQARLADGSQIQVGGYLLQVSLASPGVPPAARPSVGEPAWSGQPKDDPLALFGGSPARGPDPFADLDAPGKGPDPLPALAPPAKLPDPFADLSAPAKPPAQAPSSPSHRSDQDPLAGLQAREPSIDELLDLKPSGSPGGGQPPRPAWPLGQPDAGPGVVDPLDVMLGIVKPVPRPTVPDHGPEVSTPYAPPAARLDPAFEAVLQAPPPGPSVILPPLAPAPPADAAGPAAPPQPESRPGPPPAKPAESGVGGATEAALLQAFLQGVGLPDFRQLKSLTPETMETIGQLLREAVQGTLDLLRARGLMKSEMRADVTMIMPIENNPLKFSPTVEAALAHLLAPGVPGFLAPVRAMRDAHDDLRAHQLGFLAGMRAALDEVLARFVPSELQKRLSDPSVLDTLLPMNRKGKLWDLFVERYEDVAGEARDNFNAAFGKAFLRAYEAQVKQLRSAAPGRR